MRALDARRVRSYEDLVVYDTQQCAVLFDQQARTGLLALKNRPLMLALPTFLVHLMMVLEEERWFPISIIWSAALHYRV